MVIVTTTCPHILGLVMRLLHFRVSILAHIAEIVDSARIHAVLNRWKLWQSRCVAAT